MSKEKNKALKVQAHQHESYTTYTVIAFLVPFVGFILGAILLGKENKLDKKLGEHIIVISVLASIIAAIGWIYWMNQSAQPTIYTNPYSSY